MCEIVSLSDADFIKTSTGFSTSGATIEDIKLLKKHMKSSKGIKAAGGISSFEDAEIFVQNGATRLGTSRLVKIMLSNE
ncbi:MAG: deoxyribose-phosphate aldolase [Clostridia bacterium]|nr:deoxyribose-phosphate aldolase [Clostridia bacterium]